MWVSYVLLRGSRASPMIFHIGFAFRWRAYSKFFGGETIVFVECTGVHVDLQCKEPDMIRRKSSCIIKQVFSYSAVLIIGMNVQVIDEIISHCHKSDRMFFAFHYEDLIFR